MSSSRNLQSKPTLTRAQKELKALNMLHINSRKIQPLVTPLTKFSAHQIQLPDTEEDIHKSTTYCYYIVMYVRSRKQPALDVDRHYGIAKALVLEDGGETDLLAMLCDFLTERETRKYLCENSHITTFEVSMKNVGAMQRVLQYQEDDEERGSDSCQKRWLDHYVRYELMDTLIDRDQLTQLKKLYSCRKCALDSYSVNGFKHAPVHFIQQTYCLH